MANQTVALSYAVRLPVVLKYFGELCLVLAALTLLPFGAFLLFGDFNISLRYTLVIVGVGSLGAVLSFLREPSYIQPNEAMVLVALIFLFTPLVMSYPMMGTGLNFLDALFEAISGGTTTGLSTTATVEDKPSTFLLARAWMQWYGGLGIVILLALIMQPGRVVRSLTVTEEQNEDLIGSIRAHATWVLIVYGILTGIGIIGLWLLRVGLLNAVLYTFAAVSTGGFAPYDASLASLGGWLPQAMVIVLCLAGSISIIFYRRVYHEGWRTIFSDRQTRAIVFAGVLTTILLAVCLSLTDGRLWSQTLLHAPMLAFSAQTTAGFSTMDVAQLSAASKLVLIISMVVGGGIGSTAGGFKILRLLILLRLIHLLVVRTCLPKHAVLSPRLGNQRIKSEEIQETLLIILLFFLVIVISWLPFVVMGYDALDSLFEVVSATGTVGLSVGISAPNLSPLLKGILCVDMLMGRLEIIAWLVLLYPRTWFGKRRKIS